MISFEIVMFAPKSGVAKQRCYLIKDNWDDWGFKTSFELYYANAKCEILKIGGVKIGKQGMTTKKRITELLSINFEEIEESFFSLGQGEEYYGELLKLSLEEREEILVRLKDIAFDDKLYEIVKQEDVTQTSLMRGITDSTVKGQYRRMAHGGVKLLEYNFTYQFNATDEHIIQNEELSFEVIPNSKPPSNIHIIIGRNGVGKTTLLKKISKSLIYRDNNYGIVKFGRRNDSPFANLIYISFSAFDSVDEEDIDVESGIKYTYIGLKKTQNREGKTNIATKTLPDLAQEFSESFLNCSGVKKKTILKGLSSLNYDPLFKNANILDLAEVIDTNNYSLSTKAKSIFNSLSSGHKIVLLTVTQLVEKVEEKTLVLFDEPEAHLHPPLLSALIRTISDLLIERNGVAIIATHSPVVLQEVPGDCVWVISRVSSTGKINRPAIETFGEGVGVLTREVFGLEVTETGYHKMLELSIEDGDDYTDIVSRFEGNLGGEARALAKLLLAARNSGGNT